MRAAAGPLCRAGRDRGRTCAGPRRGHGLAAIVRLYSAARGRPTPVVELNRAVAIAMADGIEHGLALLDTIHLPGYHLLPAARADLLRRLGRRTEAAAAYRQALALVTNTAERQFLERRFPPEVSLPTW